MDLASIHENILSANLEGVAIYPHRRILADLAGSHIVLPAVPRASHDVPIHDPFAQRPTPMEASIVDGIELAAHIGQSNCFALHLKLADRSRRDFIRLCCSCKPHLVVSFLFPISVSLPSVSSVLNSFFSFFLSILAYSPPIAARISFPLHHLPHCPHSLPLSAPVFAPPSPRA